MIRVDSKQLHDAVKAVEPLTRGRQSLPILGHVLISGNGRLELTSTDLEVGVRTWIDVQADNEFSICLPGSKFKDMITNSAGELEISVNKFCAKLSSASGIQELGGMDAADYPAWFDRQGSSDCTVSTKEFMAVMKRAIQSSDTSRNSRYNLNGVLLDGPAGVVVATDEHRLQKISVDWIPETVKTIIPARALKQALASISKFKNIHELTLWFEDKNLWITSEVFEITILLMEGAYSQYEKVIPERREDDAITVNTKEFIKAVKQVKVMTGHRNSKLELWPGESMVLRCIDPYMGSAQTEIDTEFHGCAGDIPERVALNVNYVLDAARKCKDDTIRLWLNRKGANFIGEELVMPMAIEDKEFGPVPERVTSYPVFVPSGVPFEPHPTYPGLPQDEGWVKRQRPGRQNRDYDDSRIYARLAPKSQLAGPVEAEVERKAKRHAKPKPCTVVNPVEKTPKKATKAVLNAWRYIQDENPGDEYRWIESYTRKDGVQVRGHWRKRPVRVTMKKAA